MSLPSSGPLSMGMINEEANLTLSTPDTKIAGSDTPIAGSLVKLYENNGVNQISPHNLSEFYSKTYSQFSHNVLVRKEASTFNPALRIYYSYNFGAWTLLFNSTAGTSYTNCGSIGCFAGEYIYFGVRTVTDLNAMFGVGFNGPYSGYCGISSYYSVLITSNSTTYLNARVISSALVTC